MKRNKTNGCFVVAVTVVFLLCSSLERLYAQDPLPPIARVLEPLNLPGQTKEMHSFGRLIVFHDSLPESFKHTADNVIYPLVTRRCLESDFGAEAVYPDSITYRTGGLAHETGEPGLVYHIMGVNGATCVTFTTENKIKEIAALRPDLIILSFGTNEAHSRRYLAPVHEMQIDRLLSMLKKACPETVFLLTTPPGAYVGRRRSRVINPRTVTVSRIIREYARKHGMAVWDMYTVVGGKTDACKNWTRNHLLRADGIHFTPEGYRLQGNLLHQALIKAYNEYVATGLE